MTALDPLAESPSSTSTVDFPEYLPIEDGSLEAVIAAVRKGLPAQAFDWIRNELNLTTDEISDVLQIAKRTVSRRRKEGQLKPDESERVLRLIRLYAKAAEVFGRAEEARQWMKEPNFALGDSTPLAYADTEPGGRRVEQLLGQIEHGIVT